MLTETQVREKPGPLREPAASFQGKHSQKLRVRGEPNMMNTPEQTQHSHPEGLQDIYQTHTEVNKSRHISRMTPVGNTLLYFLFRKSSKISSSTVSRHAAINTKDE